MAKKGKGKGNDGKKTRTPKKPTQLWKCYEVQGDKLIRKNPFSPKSKGDFMAVHKNRTVCGKTGYTEFKSKKSEE